jgi:ubiquinone/menaquinone biosynthesis C-methylase UbiE
MVHKFDAKKAGILDDPERAKFLDPDNILEKLKLTGDIVLADLGCGTGFFSIPASRRVKKVFALDIQQEMLDILITNIEAILSEESYIPLSDKSVNILLMANVFHELEDKLSLLKEVNRVLKMNGRLMIIDWKKMEMDFGPPLKERLDEKEVIATCFRNGFTLLERSNIGPYNYLLIFGR